MKPASDGRILVDLNTLRQAQRGRASHLGMLARTGRLVTSSLNMTDVLAAIARAAAEIGRAPFASLWLADEATQTLTVGATSDGSVWRDCPVKTLRFDESLIGVVAREKRPISVPDVFSDDRVVTREWFRAHGLHSYYGVPVLFQSSILGVLNLNGPRPFRFNRDEHELLEGFAAQAAVAIRNARLYEDVSKARDFLRSIADGSADAIVTTDVEGLITYFSPGAEDIFRCRAPDVVGRPIAGFYSGGDEEAHAVVRQVSATGRLRNHETTFLTKDGTRLEISTSYSLLRAAGGAVTGVLAVSKDITERRRADRALQESEARYRTLVEGSIQGIWIHANFIIQFANQGAARIFGSDSAEALIGADLRDLVAPHERERLHRYQDARLRGEPAPLRYEFEAVRPDGAAIWVENVASVVSWNGRQAILATLLDVTELKRAEHALRAAEEQLLQAQKMDAVGRLAGGVAHDFNNLLTVIGGRTRLILQRGDSGDVARRDLELIEKTVNRAAGVTRQLLAFSRKQVLQPKVLDIKAVVGGLAPMLHRLIGEDIELVVAPAAEAEHVKGDQGQLEQVIVNLTVNARDAMPNGGRLVIETATVVLDETFARRHPDMSAGLYVMLAVSDTGGGISAEIRPHIFEPFFTTKEPDKGTGLGLSMVYGIVKQSGGEILVYSEVGVGTTFKLYLPRVTEDGAVPTVHSGAGAALPRGSETILLVEDEEEVNDLARECLEGSGYRVLAARHPGQALLMAERHKGPIDLLLTDVVMPHMNGGELSERIGAMRPGIRVLYVSGYTNAAISHRKELRGGGAFLEKPFMPDALVAKVREVIDSVRSG
jgi:PAS domain S-box-containing protein